MQSSPGVNNFSAEDTAPDVLFAQVVKLLWKLGAKSNYDQFMLEAQALWLDIFSEQPERVTLLLEELKNQNLAQLGACQNQNLSTDAKYDQVSHNNHNLTSPSSPCSSASSGGYSPGAKGTAFSRIEQTKPGKVAPPDTPILPAPEGWNLNQLEHRPDNVNCFEGAVQGDQHFTNFVQVLSLDLNTITYICLIFPKLQGDIAVIARLWGRYESTKYSYASTKKWTWKRSKLTEGTEMLQEGLLDVKLRFENLCKRLVTTQQDQNNQFYDPVLIGCLQQTHKSLTFLKNVLSDVTNRLQKRNQMQRSQELAQERLRIAESEYKKQNCDIQQHS